MLEVARDDFPADYTLVSGKPIRIADENTGEEFTAYIKDVELDSVTLDFNHPLAGERLQFDVKVVDIREASELELSHGHVHRAEEEDHLD
jgi:FKBP-type peptidyl-prolyl cis-trans isomerase SlyD